MLKLCNIVKNYPTATTTVHALRGVSVEFRENEFVAILGPSGCGKTTMLNIIGGLDRYTSGDLVIGGVSTASFDDLHWDAYRNATIGFVFQSYNLIPHLTVLENVELALSLSGEKKKTRRSKSIAALNRVGMAEHINKRPNQLSGGQMQRVAIARAIVNDPKIILADEPTGALDSELSVQVMDILAEISNHCLVIMVTHNAELAAEYATRTCRFKDGLLVEDTNPFVSVSDELDDSAVDSDEIVESAEHKEQAAVNGNESIFTSNENNTENGNGFDELTTDTLSVQEEGAHSVEPAADVNYDELASSKEEIELSEKKSKNKPGSNRKRKKQMRKMHVDTHEVFDKLGLNSLSKQKKKAEKKSKTFKPTSMSAAMAFGLSIRNLVSKRKRTLLTAFAGSIGIIGLGLVLSISNGFNIFVDKMQTEMMAGVPLGMYEYNVEVSAIMDVMSNMMQPVVSEGSHPDSSDINVVEGPVGGSTDVNAVMSSLFKSVSRNDLTEEFDQYLRKMPKDYYSVYNPYYGVQYNIIAKTINRNGEFIYANASQKPETSSALTITTSIIGESGVQPANWQVLVGDEANMLKSYDVLGGRYPQNKNELVLCVGPNNEISMTLFKDFGVEYIKTADGKIKPVESIVDENIQLDIDYFLNNPVSLKLVSNNDYYIPDPSDSTLFHEPNEEQSTLEARYNKGEELKIVGVIRPKKDDASNYVSSAICYTPELADYVVNQAYESNIAKAQRDLIAKEDGTQLKHRTVFGGDIKDDEITENTQIINLITTAKLEWTSHLKAIGATKAPTYINVYPETYEQKENAAKYIAKWNETHKQADGSNAVGYLDVSEMTVYMLRVMIDLMSIILVAVASISLVVSTVMIGVITSNSVIERIREIGILRSLGARKRDIRNVFITETSIVGLTSGIMGIVITYILCPLISLVIGAVSGVGDLLHFHPLHAFLLVVASLAMTVISGVIPAISASRKNVVDALRVD